MIDWAGCLSVGYPGVDALRFSLSASRNDSRSARWLDSYCAMTGLSRTEFSFHCMSGIGHLGADLNNFPKERFNLLAENVVKYLMRCGFLK